MFIKKMFSQQISSQKVFSNKWFNKSVLLVGLCASIFTLSTSAQDFSAANSSKLTNLCMTAISGNRAAMHNQIKASGYSKKFIVANVQCNGEKIANFIYKNGHNSENMLKVIGTHAADTSITDLAMNH